MKQSPRKIGDNTSKRRRTNRNAFTPSSLGAQLLLLSSFGYLAISTLQNGFFIYQSTFSEPSQLHYAAHDPEPALTLPQDRFAPLHIEPPHELRHAQEESDTDFVSNLLPPVPTAMPEHPVQDQIRSSSLPDAVSSSDTISARPSVNDDAIPTSKVAFRIMPHQPAVTNKQEATFSFEPLLENMRTARCKVDMRSFSECESPKRYKNLGAGMHTFSLLGMENEDSEPVMSSFSWLVDVERPVVTLTGKPSPASPPALSLDVLAAGWWQAVACVHSTSEAAHSVCQLTFAAASARGPLAGPANGRASTSFEVVATWSKPLASPMTSSHVAVDWGTIGNVTLLSTDALDTPTYSITVVASGNVSQSMHFSIPEDVVVDRAGNGNAASRRALLILSNPDASLCDEGGGAEGVGFKVRSDGYLRIGCK
ncbi:hypothetical protein CYMTET_30490 [Cymbomonas tetramitiformis]|uniref:Uncharacterized protein n=1 Tax=Cymbomonas tetramitiformis TaxID=36881 RepID=A0AAE0FIP9_9CHLO|nr:hypothetical protein CYMTET_30490 [Cymbomonas tetramitiformis]